jgi:phage repressor protein C with HTH and peptisase S24 domain
MAKQLGRLTAQHVELKSFNAAYADLDFPMSEIAFIHRIVWVSQ